MDQLNLPEKQESLDFLNYQIRACERCNLSATRKHALTGEENNGANVLFVALSPGAKEDLGNRMFIGPSGQVFNRLLQNAGIDRESVYMTNLVKCILPMNRKPTIEEIGYCSSFLDGMKIFPLTHPSALLYNPSFESGTIEKYKKLKSIL